MGVNVPQVQAVVPGHLANPAPYPQPSRIQRISANLKGASLGVGHKIPVYLHQCNGPNHCGFIKESPLTLWT